MRRLASDVKKTGTENYVRRDPSRKQRGMLPADTNRLTNSWKDKRVKPTPGLASAQMPFSGCAALGTTQVGQWLAWPTPPVTGLDTLATGLILLLWFD